MEQLPSIRQWAEQRLEVNFGNCYTIANYFDGELRAVAVFNNFRQTSAEFSIVLRDRRGMSKDFLGVCSDYIFNFCGLNRLTAFVSVTNKESNALIKKAGFTYEGCQRKAADGLGDLNMYGMLKNECRWLWDS